MQPKALNANWCPKTARQQLHKRLPLLCANKIVGRRLRAPGTDQITPAGACRLQEQEQSGGCSMSFAVTKNALRNICHGLLPSTGGKQLDDGLVESQQLCKQFKQIRRVERVSDSSPQAY